jgi:hypothetical protein
MRRQKFGQVASARCASRGREEVMRGTSSGQAFLGTMVSKTGAMFESEGIRNSSVTKCVW